MSDKTFKVSAPLVSIYVGAVAAIYQHTYWKPFHVNILQYIGLTDMIKLTLWPLIGFGASFLVGYAANKSGLVGGSDPPLPEKYKHFGPVRAAINRHHSLVAVILMLVLGTVSMFVHELPQRWVTLSFLLGLVSHVMLTVKGMLSEHFSDFSTRYLAVGLLTIIPWYAWGDAKTSAEQIRRGFEYDSVSVSAEFRTSADIPVDVELRHLGNTGTYTLMLLDKGPRVVVARNDDVGPVVLTRVQNMEGK